MTIHENAGRIAERRETPGTSCEEVPCLLTDPDRIVIERFISFAENSRVVYSQTLLDLLQDKLLMAGSVPGMAPAGLATFGRHVSCLFDGRKRERGVLSFGLVSRAGEISLHSLLGATLIGMSAGQQGLVPGEDGRNRRVVLQSVT